MKVTLQLVTLKKQMANQPNQTNGAQLSKQTNEFNQLLSIFQQDLRDVLQHAEKSLARASRRVLPNTSSSASSSTTNNPRTPARVTPVSNVPQSVVPSPSKNIPQNANTINNNNINNLSNPVASSPNTMSSSSGARPPVSTNRPTESTRNNPTVPRQNTSSNSGVNSALQSNFQRQQSNPYSNSPLPPANINTIPLSASKGATIHQPGNALVAQAQKKAKRNPSQIMKRRSSMPKLTSNYPNYKNNWGDNHNLKFGKAETVLDNTSDLDVGATPEYDEESYNKALQCIINGNMISFSEVLQDFPNVNMSSPSDQSNTCVICIDPYVNNVIISLLHWCVLYNNIHMAKMLLESGARQLANSLGKTPLELAKDMCEAGDFSYIEMRNTLQNGLKRGRKRSN